MTILCTNNLFTAVDDSFNCIITLITRYTLAKHCFVVARYKFISHSVYVKFTLFPRLRV